VPEPVAAPPVVVEARGSPGDGPHLLAMQLWVTPADYASAGRFEALLARSFAAAADRALLTPRTVVVLPEYTGSWLVLLDEDAAAFTDESLGGAMTALALRQLGAFLWSSWGSGQDDGDAYAAFNLKATQMAATYHETLSSLAARHGVTVVGGSILLPAPRLESSALVVTPGGPLRNVSVVYGPSGRALGMSKKVFPTADEQGFVTAATPQDISVVDTPAGRLGVLVCADAWLPESYRRLQDEGATLLAVPTFHAGDGIWDAPWGGYSGHSPPADVDRDDIGRLTEATAWDSYALAGRAKRAGIRGAISAPLRGVLWDIGTDGQAFLVDRAGFQRTRPDNAPGLFSLWIEE
jgi:predicted amidohydrolase